MTRYVHSAMTALVAPQLEAHGPPQVSHRWSMVSTEEDNALSRLSPAAARRSCGSRFHRHLCVNLTDPSGAKKVPIYYKQHRTPLALLLAHILVLVVSTDCCVVR